MNDNDSTAPTRLAFIPIGRVISDPVEIGTAITLALYNRPSADATVWQGPNGEMVIEVFNPRTGKLERFRPGEDHGPAQDYTIMLVHGGAVITRAMREGAIEAFIIDPTGRYLRVPRLYWLQANPTTDTALIQTGHVPSELVGCPVLVDPAHIAKWQQIAQPQVEAMLTRVRQQRGEKVVQIRPSASKFGPDPFKEYSMLERVFQAHDERLANFQSDRARHDYLKSIWLTIANKVGRETCPSYEVVRRCWSKFKA